MKEYSAPDHLIGIAPVMELIKTVIWTGHVTGERPVSLILVAPPGHGKTSMLQLFRSNWSCYTDDMTSREFKFLMEKYPQATHVMLSDMTSIFNRKNSTSDLTCNILRRAIEEGIEVDSFSGKHYDDGARRIGFITAIPPDDMDSRKVKGQLEEGGFASRFIIAKYRYSQGTKRAIHEYIQSDAYTKTDENHGMKFDERQNAITIPKPIAERIKFLAIDIKRDPLGARAHHHLRALVKASALQHNRHTANDEDFTIVENYSEFFTSKGKVL